MRKRRICSARRNFLKSLKMTGPFYKSMMKLHGVPMVPPVIKDSDRPMLRRYREEAVKIEAALAEKRRKRQEELKTSVVHSQERSVSDLNDSVASNVDTAQVLNFIRQALRDSSHVEEVQQLQQAIFEELQKYQSPPSSVAIRRCDSMDTLHNIDDFSNAAASSYEVSPTKSFPSEKFPSPPTNHLNVAEVQRTDENSPGSRLSVLTSSPLESAGDLTEPRLSLNYSNKENSLSVPGYRELNSPLPTFDPSVPDIAALDNSPETSAPNYELDSPPRPLRRNSYTLESPSPSLVQYLKSLNIDNESKSQPLDKSSKRNLNRVWSDVLSADGSTSTPINQSALSWKSNDKSDQSSSSEQENLSVILNNNSDVNSSGNNNEKKTVEKKHLKVYNVANKWKYSGNNKVSAVVEAAAAKIQAGIRGYLTRRLLKTGRIVELKNAIRDSLVTALQMHTETSVSKAELELHRRLAMQIESLCDEWHEIFFEYTPQQRMRLIAVDRNKSNNPKPKMPFLRRSKSKTSMESSATSLTSSTKSMPARPKSLPLTKPLHTSASQYKPWK